jgi:hypothetical protein
VDPPAGEGYVCFSIWAKDGLASGTEIKNNASILFDYNPAIMTNEVVNTIDTECPSSHIHPMDQEQPTDFSVSWTGEDGVGSGVAMWDVYVSVDGGAFTLWLDGTPNASAVYHGEVGHTYGFYCITCDNVGNMESTAKIGEVSIKVVGTHTAFPVWILGVLAVIALIAAIGVLFIMGKRRK